MDLEYGEYTPDANTAGCRNLVAECLSAAILDFSGLGPEVNYETRGTLKSKARNFIVDDTVDSSCPFSFPWLCDVLDLDCECLRKGILNGSVRRWSHLQRKNVLGSR